MADGQVRIGPGSVGRLASNAYESAFTLLQCLGDDLAIEWGCQKTEA